MNKRGAVGDKKAGPFFPILDNHLKKFLSRSKVKDDQK